MSRNGSGSYSAPASSFPVVSGTLIESAKFNTTINDIASALTQSISNDGQTPILANLPMGGFKLTGLAAGVASGQSVEFGQLAAYAPLASPVLTGNPTAPTPTTGDNDTSIATTAFVTAAVVGFAPLASPALTGNPTAPTPAPGDNDTSIATTAFVTAGFVSPAFTGTPTAPTAAVGTNTTQLATTAFVIANGGITHATMQTASGTAVNFTSIPSNVKRITVMFNVVSTNGTSVPILQLGTSGGYQVTGYSSCGSVIGTGTGVLSYTNAFALTYNSANWSAVYSLSGAVILSLMDTSTGLWVCNGTLSTPEFPFVEFVSGAKTLSGTLDRVRITTVNGTDTFDAGNINIMYE